MKQTTPTPLHLGISSNQCRIPNVNISKIMSIKLILWIFSNVSFEVNLTLLTFCSSFPELLIFIIMYFNAENHTKTNLSKPFSHTSCILSFSSCVSCFLLIILAFPDTKPACFSIDVIKDNVLEITICLFEEVHWQRTYTGKFHAHG